MDQKFSTLLSKGVSRIIDQKHLEERLERGDVLRVKFGIDPTGTIVHLGHIVHKMSKTGGNCIAVDMPANDMFVKLMEVKDELILEFFRLTTLMTNEEVDMVGERLKAGEHPKDIKLELARTVVTMYHGIEAAIEAQAYFEKVLTNGVMPSEDEMPKAYLESGLGIISVVKELWYFTTTGDARNGVIGGEVKLNGIVITDIQHTVILSPTIGTIIQAGKKKFTLVYVK